MIFKFVTNKFANKHIGKMHQSLFKLCWIIFKRKHTNKGS